MTRVRSLFSDTVLCQTLRLLEFHRIAGIEDRRRQSDIQSSAGRALARRLLGQFGAPDVEVAVAADRSPVWPRGFVGSISHTEDRVVVAVARQRDFSALGVDVETILEPRALREIGPVVFGKSEMSLVESATKPTVTATICFSAKEAFYKCLYPLTQRFFDFKDVEVEALDTDTGCLRMRLKSTISKEFHSGHAFKGAFLVEGRNVFTAFEQRYSGA